MHSGMSDNLTGLRVADQIFHDERYLEESIRKFTTMR